MFMWSLRKVLGKNFGGLQLVIYGNLCGAKEWGRLGIDQEILRRRPQLAN